MESYVAHFREAHVRRSEKIRVDLVVCARVPVSVEANLHESVKCKVYTVQSLVTHPALCAGCIQRISSGSSSPPRVPTAPHFTLYAFHPPSCPLPQPLEVPADQHFTLYASHSPLTPLRRARPPAATGRACQRRTWGMSHCPTTARACPRSRCG